MHDLARNAHEDSLESSIDNWGKLSRYIGPRRAEWCQRRKTIYDRGPDDSSLAFRRDDFQFYNSKGRELDPELATFEEVDHSSVRFRWQKNKDNGEKIRQYRDRECPNWCPTRAQWDIVQRAIRLGIPREEPLGQYRDEKGKVFFITDTDVKVHLQTAARESMGITDPAVLSKWTCHSLRITAANELHRRGFSGLFIQHRLRWKSKAFMKYLRHTVHVARKHTEAMRLYPKNLLMEESNLSKTNRRRREDNLFSNIHREPGVDDILWEENFYQSMHQPAIRAR